MPGMVETATGDLDVGLGPGDLRTTVVVPQGIEAGQAGAGRQEDCQQEECLGPAKARYTGGNGATHMLEYTQASAMLRLTGPSTGRMNQKAAPFP